MIEKLLSHFDNHMQEILRGSTIIFGLKVIAAGITFVLNVALARLLGIESSGIYFLAFTVVQITATVGAIGMGNSLVRFIAANIVAEQTGNALGVYRKATLYSFGAAALLSVMLFMFSPLLSHSLFNKQDLEQPLTFMALSVVPLALLGLHAHALQGMKKFADSVVTLNIIVPSVTCLLAFIFIPINGINGAVIGYVIATAMALAFGRHRWKTATKGYAKRTETFASKELLQSSLPLLVASFLVILISSLPVLLLGIFSSSSDVAVFSAAIKTALLIGFIIVSINTVLNPKYAALYQQGDKSTIARLARNSAKTTYILTAPLLLFMIFLPELILDIFGKEFRQGSTVLMILASGIFINGAMGHAGYLLIMTGNEKLYLYNLLITVMVGLVVSSVLISYYGLIGAAVSTVVMFSAQTFISVYSVWKHLDIMVIPWVYRDSI